MTPDDNLFPMYHKRCNQAAFFSIGKFQEQEIILSSRIVLFNGSNPQPNSEMICGTCGTRIAPRELYYDDARHQILLNIMKAMELEDEEKSRLGSD